MNEWIHELCYLQHGGDGYSFTRRDILSMDVIDVQWHIDRVRRARREMAQAIKRAQQKK